MEKSNWGEMMSIDRGSQGTNWFPGTAVMFATLPTIKYNLRVPLNESIIVV